MVARLFRLRVALLGGVFRGSFATGLRNALILIALAALAVGLAALPLLLDVPADQRAQLDTVLGGAVLALAFVIAFFASPRMLNPRQFATAPAAPGSVARSMVVTSVVTWTFIVFAIWLIALGVLREEWRSPGWAAPVALVLAALVGITGTRLTSGLSQLIVGQNHEGALRAVGWVLLIAALPVVAYAASTALGSGAAALPETARVLSLSPFGAPFEGVRLAALGDTGGAALRFGIAAISIVLFVLLWMWTARVMNTRIERPADPAIARRGLGWFERFAARPAQAIAARGLTYWSRDPRYRVGLFAVPIAPFVMLVALWVAGVDIHVLALIPLPVIMFLLGWSQHNDVAMDSTAIWMHVVSGTRGRADRAGRLIPVLLAGLPMAIIGSSVTVTLLGDWRVLPAVLGMNLGILFTASAVTSVFSVLMPYPVTRPGDSPFVQPQWQGSGAGLSQTLSIVTALVLCAPIVWMSVVAIVDVEFIPNMLALLVGVGWGLLMLMLGILIGGWIFDRSGPELIQVTQVFD